MLQKQHEMLSKSINGKLFKSTEDTTGGREAYSTAGGGGGVCGGPNKQGRKAGIPPNARNCASLSNYFGASGKANIRLTHHNPCITCAVGISFQLFCFNHALIALF